MSASLNSEFSSIKEKLADADVDEVTLVKVAAIIAGKYDLVPRGSGAVARASAPPSRPKTRTNLQDEEIERELLEEYPHLKDLPEEERKREIVALRAEAEREFGLSKGEVGAVKGPKGVTPPELTQAFEDLMPPSSPGFGDLDGGRSDPDTMQRLAKLASLKSNPSINRFRRSDG
jgi:hypothetical protein